MYRLFLLANLIVLISTTVSRAETIQILTPASQSQVFAGFDISGTCSGQFPGKFVVVIYCVDLESGEQTGEARCEIDFTTGEWSATVGSLGAAGDYIVFAVLYKDGAPSALSSIEVHYVGSISEEEQVARLNGSSQGGKTWQGTLSMEETELPN